MSFSPETPFKISVPDVPLSLLQRELAFTSFPDQIKNAGWVYGTPLANVKRLVNRWKDYYDRRKHDSELNAELPQFTRDIDVEGFGTLNVHYMHKKSEVENAIPLLFVHGWPGSFIEVRKILPLLVEASADHPSFHVVAISLPGCGFGISQYAELGNKLMLALGYDGAATGATGSHAESRTYKALNTAKRGTRTSPEPLLPLSQPLLLLSHLLS